MKRLIIAGLMISAVISTSDARPIGWRQSGVAMYANYNSGVVATFHAPLSPYGEWIDCNYGYVWRPYSVGAHWRPYLHGRWVWTDYGWYWTSYEPYGWAVYHYGRWTYDDYYGWIWIPDEVWGPAWVEWRYDDDYIGWAPLTPYATFDVSFGITLRNGWVAPVHYWNFVPCQNFAVARVDAYVQPVEQTRRFFGSTRIVPSIRTEQNRVVNRGVDPGIIERKSGSQIKRIDVVETNRGTGDRIVRGQNTDRVEVYRPNISRSGRGENVQPRLNEPQHRDLMKEFKDEHRINTPDNSGIRRNSPPSIRQFRESEQRFEIPNLKESFERRQNMTGREARSTPRQDAGQASQDAGQIRQQTQPAQPHDQTPRTNQQAAPAPRQQNSSRSDQHQAPPARSGRRP